MRRELQDLSELLALHMRTRHVRVSLTLEKQISEDSQYSNVRKFTGKRRSEPLTMAESTFLGLLATEGFEEFYREGQFSVLGATIERADDGSTSFSVTFAKDETKFEPAAFVEDMNVFRRDKGMKGLTLSPLQAELEKQASERKSFDDMALFKETCRRSDRMFLALNLGECGNTPLISQCLLVPEFKECLKWRTARYAAVTRTVRNSEDILLLLLGK